MLQAETENFLLGALTTSQAAQARRTFLRHAVVYSGAVEEYPLRGTQTERHIVNLTLQVLNHMLLDTPKYAIRHAAKTLCRALARRRAHALRQMARPTRCTLLVAGLVFLANQPAYADASEGDPARAQVVVETSLSATAPGRMAQSHAIVINEINYNAHDDYDSGDWIELYNAGTADADLTGWTYSDEDDDHVFMLPAGTVLKSGEYLVVAQEIARFAAIHPDVSNVVGDADFGLAGGGELVRLFDASGAIADSLVYDDKEPWPEKADGDGYTLELTDPTCDNALPECWRASAKTNGSPGAENGQNVTAAARETPEAPFQIDIYPNPAGGRATVAVSGSAGETAKIRVFDIRGRQVPVPAARIALPGNVALDTSELATGLYFVRIASPSGTMHQGITVRR